MTAACGTTAGYTEHRMNSEEACDECKAAIAKRHRDLRHGAAKKKKSTPQDQYRTVPCPYCGAAVGAYCRNGKTTDRLSYQCHGDRVHAYEAA